MSRELWAAGVDLGGTKIQIIQVNAFGTLGERVRLPTDAAGGHEAVEHEIINAIRALEKKIGSPPLGIGVGIAGQIEKGGGIVNFAPNLKWHNVPFRDNLYKALGIPVVITNDVRAATWGEWLHGAGKGCDNLICIFVGTGIGGGIVSEGQMIEGYANTAGEIGHMIVQIGGPECTCGSRGCMEAFAGGWAMTKSALQLAKADPQAARALIELAGGDRSAIGGKEIQEAFNQGDPHAIAIVSRAKSALIAGTVSLVNALSPERVIFGGGVIEGMEELIPEIEKGVKELALKAATKNISFVRAKLHNDAGAIGAGALALRTFEKQMV